MKTVAQAKITINGKHSIFHIFDWQGPDINPAPCEWKGHEHIVTMSQAVWCSNCKTQYDKQCTKNDSGTEIFVTL